ncbi:Uncharacterized protein dnl_21030 [Desulfonema limicola]|uniref:Uncharacterized protein n=1 Tax=Desulfonema limicola TaxID=45656 RepID=A0A975B6S1_9BACT|nr:hypothetical protein [Desulfonema limicola]QTA79821.1 Uncharacterized protein dnl_21030 [Desulfonema limicola]
MMSFLQKVLDNLEKNYGKPAILLTAVAITIIELIGIIFLLMFSLSTDDWAKIFTTLSMIAFASLGIGVIIGFLFGIPMTVQEISMNPQKSEQVKTETILKPVQRSYKINTNLEQVSDWLTKIIVGVGLIQFKEMRIFMDDLLAGFIKSLPSLETAKPLMTATIVLYVLLGFVGGYMATRLYLSGKFLQADKEIENNNSNQ